MDSDEMGESDEDESASPSPKKGGKKPAAPKVGPNGQQEECKQQ